MKTIIGVPDFIIGDETSAILAEIKITAKYDLQQFIKYQTFAMLCKALNYLPDNFSHLIITANLEPDNFIKDYKKLATGIKKQQFNTEYKRTGKSFT